ncbi:endonuclease/exonuclease/phosphatase family protein [uncultured Tateyamaria sp.]|uniref:endonuclease/exonuclease/phosphatase family protein n=1 Tax=uncultured Tateyamaria sp. TaxID=455651 RepID=UPI002629D275|nr:endonuclease/exonuclease/phosphatase family protein [uncultured Tateyamaria sp.]
MITDVRTVLEPVSEEQRARILSAPRTADAHRQLLNGIPAMNAVQCGGRAQRDRLPSDITVVAWNVERCLFPEACADHLEPIKPDVVLLSEVDNGMARTSQRHTTESFADALSMVYAYGVEFHELGLGGPTELPLCTDDFNVLGWHGNAILSAVPFDRVAMVRLDDHGHWFAGDSGASDPEQPRVGGRMALLAELPTEKGPITVVSTHLESNADAPHRHRQFDILLDAIDDFAPSGPVVIGGDLNTGNHMPPDFDWRQETLFSLAESRGYSWEFTAEGTTTRPSLITPHPDRQMKLDWIAGGGLRCQECGIRTSLSDAGQPLSDHDLVWAAVSLD